MTLRKEDLSNEPLSNQPAGVAPVVEALTQIAADPKVIDWFGRGGNKITFVHRMTSVGWSGMNISVLELVNISDEMAPEVSLGLIVRDGGYAANKIFSGSGMYFFEDGRWEPSINVKDFPRLEENPAFMGLVEGNGITAETITTKTESKLAVTPMAALPEDEREALVNKAKEMYWTGYELNGLMAVLDETPAVNFVGRYKLYKDIEAKQEEAKRRLPGYQEAFAERDDVIHIPEGEGGAFDPAVDILVDNFGVAINRREGELENYTRAFSKNVLRAVEGLALRAFWNNDDRLATCRTAETLRETLKVSAASYEEATGGEIDIICVSLVI